MKNIYNFIKIKTLYNPIFMKVFSFIIFALISSVSLAVDCGTTSSNGDDWGIGTIDSDLPNDTTDKGIVTQMVKALIVTFTPTAMFYDVMCWMCLFVTAALGIKQLFIKSDADDRGGFWNVLKVAGWAIAGLAGIIIKRSISS